LDPNILVGSGSVHNTVVIAVDVNYFIEDPVDRIPIFWSDPDPSLTKSPHLMLYGVKQC
jgi:hypothetical protein